MGGEKGEATKVGSWSHRKHLAAKALLSKLVLNKAAGPWSETPKTN